MSIEKNIKKGLDICIFGYILRLTMRRQRNHIGKRIRKRRLELGWSQEYLAQVSGFSRLYILKVENGQIKSPGIKAIEKLSYCLGLKWESLCM
jgi:ribosome-binding protein aMBF1 (putative translation factor)